MPRLARTLALPLLLTAFLSGCPDTRSTCPIACDNALRCTFSTNRAACESMCAMNLARASADCRSESDRYERCWLGAGTCPASPSNAAPGCITEFNARSLACAFP